MINKSGRISNETYHFYVLKRYAGEYKNEVFEVRANITDSAERISNITEDIMTYLRREYKANLNDEVLLEINYMNNYIIGDYTE